MIRKDSIAPFPWKTRHSAPPLHRVVMSDDRTDTTLCGRGGNTREQHCQLLKLTFLAILPGIILIVQNAIDVAGSVSTFQANKQVKISVQFSMEIGAVIHALQMERGTTALYVSSGGDPFVRPRLLNLYTDTDNAINSLSRWISINQPEYFQSREQFHRQVSEFRNTLVPINTTTNNVIDFYTGNNEVFIQMIAKSINLRKPFIFWTDITSYQMLIFSKEQAGIERALGSTYYARGQLSTPDLLWYDEKQILGVSFLQQCMGYSSFARDLIDTMYTGTTLDHELQKMRSQIINNMYTVPSVVAGAMWFDNMTIYINALQIIQDRLANRIVQAVNAENDSLEETLTVSTIEFVITSIMVPIIMLLVRNIIRRIHKFSHALSIKTTELEDERKRTEELLYELLPRSVAKRLMEDGITIPEAYHSATIMFSDVVGFTLISSCSTPMQVINMLNNLYLTIDTRLEDFDVYKVETIGDGYMVASGIPSRNGERHVEEIAKLSLDLLVTIGKMDVPHLRQEKIRLRIGFNTGPCVAGVVGVKMPRYCIFGDTVNTASRMESTGLPLRIQMTESSAVKLRSRDGFLITERGTVEVKGKGLMRTFWLDGLTSTQPDSPNQDSASIQSFSKGTLTFINVKESQKILDSPPAFAHNTPGYLPTF